MRGMLAVTAGLMAIGCGDPESEFRPVTAPVSVLNPMVLTPVNGDVDPFAHHRPSEVHCPPAAWGPEGGGFEVQTGVCNYAAFDQALPMPVKAGDALSLIVWHDFLDAAEPATAHLAVWLGTTVLWETEVNIPAPSGSFEAFVPIEVTPSPNDRLGLHLHNHGFNSWRFVSIEVHPR